MRNSSALYNDGVNVWRRCKEKKKTSRGEEARTKKNDEVPCRGKQEDERLEEKKHTQTNRKKKDAEETTLHRLIFSRISLYFP